MAEELRGGRKVGETGAEGKEGGVKMKRGGRGDEALLKSDSHNSFPRGPSGAGRAPWSLSPPCGSSQIHVDMFDITFFYTQIPYFSHNF